MQKQMHIMRRVVKMCCHGQDLHSRVPVWYSTNYATGGSAGPRQMQWQTDLINRRENRTLFGRTCVEGKVCGTKTFANDYGVWNFKTTPSHVYTCTLLIHILCIGT